ncbi:capsular exopolysaccharide family [Stanieria cyanosphaera PCC 7437]|uniref:non-specific protein-tyrosine kinase n=1 Tax=Stanieria cyanosphaera (strain ATCC 29371 / PCC 7437) TaxID=111780 RepID=K9XSG1_STAC7|nr:polysaccharide biosynthesis tyrosine autokinase [Stanieria cyanosphaera]AFZ35024.1 capsular exopolysaccharide family [Stanieria cyanosphaera PCC 7437]
MESNLYTDEYLNFQKYWLVVKRRIVPASVTCLGVITLSLVTALSLEQIYEAEGQVMIKTNKSAKLTGLENDIGKIEVLTNESDPLTTEVEVVSSRPIIDRVIKELDLRNKQDELYRYKDLINNLEIKALTGSNVIKIAYEDSDPERAALVVNKIIELYQEKDTENNRSEAIAAREFISQELPEVEAKVAQAEADLRNFKNENQIANLSEETTTLIETSKLVDTQIDQVAAQLQDVNARYASLSSQLGMGVSEAAAISSLNQSVAVQKALTQLQDVKVQLATKRNLFGENAPQIISLKEQEAELTALLEQQIQQTLGSQSASSVAQLNILGLGKLKQEQISEFANLGLQKTGLEQKLANLKQTKTNYQQRLAVLPNLEKRQKELERKTKAAQATYQTLLGKLQETQVAEKQNIGTVRVLANAIPPDEPSGPSKKLIVAAGGLLGGLLGIAVAFLLDLKDNSLKNSKEIEEIFGYPLQGVIPDLEKEGSPHLLVGDVVDTLPQLPASQNAHSNNRHVFLPIREAYQILQANLKLLSLSQERKVIAVTSCVPQEGKSHVSANLAIAQNQVGKRILLIDADMRRPTQHKIWSIPNYLGLSNVLKGEVEWQEAIKTIKPGLDILTAGEPPDNAVPLIDSERMKHLIGTTALNYDHVIFDTPPITGMADTRILGRMVDGLLMVVRPGVANYGSVSVAKKLIETTGQSIIGVVANGVNLRNEAYGYDYYYYPNYEYDDSYSLNQGK